MSEIYDFSKRMGLLGLKSNQLEQIHLAALSVLEEIGVKVCEPEALELLRAAGASVNGDLVKIAPHLVESALQSAPKQITIFNRSGDPALNLKKDHTYFGSGSDTPYVIDVESGIRRQTVKQDTINAAIVADALENINFVMSMARASDMPAETIDLHHFEAMLFNSTKPIIFDAAGPLSLKKIIRIASLAAGGKKALAGRPFIILYTEPTSPFVHSRAALEKLLIAAEENIPAIYAPAVMCGATGPVTTAGALVVANAESLSGLVIHQLKNAGAPFIYGGGTPPLNMITAICSYGDPQGNLGMASMLQLASYYNLPSFSIAGCSDAQVFDQQAAMEAGLSLLTAGLAGGNLIHDLGYMGVGLTTSLEYLVLCNEAAGAVKYMIRGVEVSPETLAIDIIKKVGPGGNYMSEQHTFDSFRSQMHFTRLSSRSSYENWLAAGAKTLGESAGDLVKEILQWHEIPPLPPDTVSAIRKIVGGTG